MHDDDDDDNIAVQSISQNDHTYLNSEESQHQSWHNDVHTGQEIDEHFLREVVY